MKTTSQEIEALREEATKLGIKGVHLYKDADNLMEKIESVKGEAQAEPVRKAAPRMKVGGTGYVDYAMQRVAELEAEYPDRKYQLRAVGTADRKIRDQGFEYSGETIGDEMIVWTMLDSFEEWQAAQNKYERKKMNAIDPVEDGKIKSFNAQPKKSLADPQ